MSKIKRITYAVSLALSMLLVPYAAEAKKKKEAPPISLVLPTEANASRQYGNLDYGIRIQVVSNVGEENLIDISELSGKEIMNMPRLSLNTSIFESVESYLDNMAHKLGFNVGTSGDTDFILRVTVDELRLRITSYNKKKETGTSSAAMLVKWELLNADRDVVIPSRTTTGRASTNNFADLGQPITKAYIEAMGGIDWDRIASRLKVAKDAKQEKNAQVTGKGNTALESTVIRWFVTSRPQGADVSWRVISSTPDVSNTNSNYVGTTPYETTESFDIKGLTYNNSGNVQIEITCERPGYLAQKKRFNLQQVIDQKEISAKFNLVKEAEEETAEE